MAISATTRGGTVCNCKTGACQCPPLPISSKGSDGDALYAKPGQPFPQWHRLAKPGN